MKKQDEGFVTAALELCHVQAGRHWHAAMFSASGRHAGLYRISSFGGQRRHCEWHVSRCGAWRTLSSSSADRHAEDRHHACEASSASTSFPARETLRKMYRLAYPERRRLAYGLSMNVVASGLSLAVPMGLGSIVDISISEHAFLV